MARTIIHPWDDNKVESSNIMTTASSDSAHVEQPRSPLSGELMQKVTAGPHGGPNFDVWIHLGDRICIPYRG